MVDADPAALLATAAAQPHDPGFVPFVRRAQAAGIPVEVVSDGFGFFIEPALEALGVGELPVVTARTTFAGPAAPRSRSRTATRRCLVCGTCKRNRVLAHQAAGSRGRVHRRRRERPLRRRLRDVVFAKRSLVRICLEAGWPFQRWTEFAEIDAWLAETARRAWRADPATLPRPRPPTRSSAAPRSGARASCDPPARERGRRLGPATSVPALPAANVLERHPAALEAR